MSEQEGVEVEVVLDVEALRRLDEDEVELDAGDLLEVSEGREGLR